jgi:hypothetical protein
MVLDRQPFPLQPSKNGLKIRGGGGAFRVAEAIHHLYVFVTYHQSVTTQNMTVQLLSYPYKQEEIRGLLVDSSFLIWVILTLLSFCFVCSLWAFTFRESIFYCYWMLNKWFYHACTGRYCIERSSDLLFLCHLKIALYSGRLLIIAKLWRAHTHKKFQFVTK